MNVRTKSVPYAERGKDYVAPAGYGVSLDPVEGWYRHKLRSGAVAVGVRIWFGQPLDPVTGEPLDRHLRWQAMVNGHPYDDLERIWPGCAGEPITEIEYERYCQRQSWARERAPDSAYAEPSRKYDPLDSATPLPF